jgi:hypothetical protein
MAAALAADVVLSDDEGPEAAGAPRGGGGGGSAGPALAPPQPAGVGDAAALMRAAAAATATAAAAAAAAAALAAAQVILSDSDGEREQRGGGGAPAARARSGAATAGTSAWAAGVTHVSDSLACGTAALTHVSDSLAGAGVGAGAGAAAVPLASVTVKVEDCATSEPQLSAEQVGRARPAARTVQSADGGAGGVPTHAPVAAPNPQGAVAHAVLVERHNVFFTGKAGTGARAPRYERGAPDPLSPALVAGCSRGGRLARPAAPHPLRVTPCPAAPRQVLPADAHHQGAEAGVRARLRLPRRRHGAHRHRGVPHRG